MNVEECEGVAGGWSVTFVCVCVCVCVWEWLCLYPGTCSTCYISSPTELAEIAVKPPILLLHLSTHSDCFCVSFFFSALLYSSLSVSELTLLHLHLSPLPSPPHVWRIGLSSVMLCRVFIHTHTHTHTCRQAGAPLHPKASIPCHSPVPCWQALLWFVPKWPRLEP